MNENVFSTRRFLGVMALPVGLFLALAPRFSPLLQAQSAGRGTLTVHVTGARNAKGKFEPLYSRTARVSQTTHHGLSKPKPPTLTLKL